jgi:hypothetical protein
MSTGAWNALRAAVALLVAASTACGASAPGARGALDPSATQVAHPLLAEATPAPAAAPAAEPAKGPAAAPAPAQEEAPEHRRSRHTARTLGWVSLSIGAEAAVVAIVTSFMMLHDKDVRDAGCNANKLCTPDALSANVALDNLAWWNVSAYAVAAVGLGAGIVLLATNPPNRERSTSLVVAPNGSGAGLSLRGAF